MANDPTMRIVWFQGRPHSVTAHPLGILDEGTHWHVQTEDGDWHAVIERGEEWPMVIAAVEAWLIARANRPGAK